MFGRIVNFNIKLSPVYIVLSLILIGGIVLTGDEKTYVSDMFAVIAEVVLILLVPNIIYTFRNRNERGSFIALLCMLPIIPLPFIFIALMMMIVYL
jgi:hypothetical protein